MRYTNRHFTFFTYLLTNFIQIEAPTAEYDVISISQDSGRDGWILLPVSYLLMSLLSVGQSLSAHQILSRYLKWRLRYSYFRFRNTNVRHIGNLLSVSISTICPKSAHYSASAYRISSKSKYPLQKYDVISISQDDGRDSWILLPVSYLFMSLPSDGRSISANQISSRYLNWRLKYNYFRFRNTNVRHRPFRRNRCVILHPAAEFRPNRNIRCWNMTSYRFSRWRPSAMLYLLWGNGGPPTKCLSLSKFRPQIASSSD